MGKVIVMYACMKAKLTVEGKALCPLNPSTFVIQRKQADRDSGSLFRE